MFQTPKRKGFFAQCDGLRRPGKKPIPDRRGVHRENPGNGERNAIYSRGKTGSAIGVSRNEKGPRERGQ